MKGRNRQRLFFAFFLLLTVALAAVLLRFSQDSHMLQRIGATMAAIGAFFAILEFYFDARLEKQHEKEERAMVTLTPANQELAKKTLFERKKERYATRFETVVFSGTFIAIGEILHGWGDKIFYLFTDH